MGRTRFTTYYVFVMLSSIASSFFLQRDAPSDSLRRCAIICPYFLWCHSHPPHSRAGVCRLHQVRRGLVRLLHLLNQDTSSECLLARGSSLLNCKCKDTLRMANGQRHPQNGKWPKTPSEWQMVKDTLRMANRQRDTNAGIPPGKSDASGGIWPKNLMLK